MVVAMKTCMLHAFWTSTCMGSTLKRHTSLVMLPGSNSALHSKHQAMTCDFLYYTSPNFPLNHVLGVMANSHSHNNTKKGTVKHKWVCATLCGTSFEQRVMLWHCVMPCIIALLVCQLALGWCFQMAAIDHGSCKYHAPNHCPWT